VDRILEPQTIPHFLEFSMIGKLPGGSKTSLPLISEEYIPLLMTPYADWAPSPYNKLPNSAMTQIMIRIGSNEDDARLVVVEKKIQAMKSRLWEGIIPLSRNRWRKKRLDQPENFGMALQYLSGVVDAFNYLLQPPVSTNLRETFNLIHKELGDFEKAVNALKKGQGIKVTGLWEEYIGASYKVMTTRAHSWIIEHIKELRVPIIEAIKAHEPEDFETYSPEQWTLTNKLHDLTELGARADFTILMSMDGYMGFSPLPNATEGQSPDLEKRKKYYGDRLKLLSRKKSFNSITLKNLAQEPSAEPRRESRGLGDPLDIIETYGEQTEAQDELREEIREPFTLELGEKSPEQWIVDLRDQVLEREEDPVKEWGFVIYRLTYSQTDDEWNAFKHKFEADAADWGDGVDGADLIRDMAKLKWVDGQEHGIADGDVAAATK
jgi:hypothetical protein